MRLRWKILILLLAISLVPILLLRIAGQRSMRHLGNDLAERTRNVLIDRAGTELEMIVEEHARILQRERELLEAVLYNQALELEKRLGNFHHQNGADVGRFVPADAENTTEFQTFEDRFRVSGMGRYMPLPVAYDRLTILPNGHRPTETDEFEPMLRTMVPVYRRLTDRHPDLIFWQLTAFENGLQSIYPAVAHVPMRYDALRSDWYRRAIEEKSSGWTLPSFDPLTRRIAFTVSTPIHATDGSILGVTAIVVPVSLLLQEDDHIRALSEDVQSLLARPESDPGTGRPMIKIIAREHRIASRHHHWRALLSEERFEAEAPDQIEKIHTDLKQARSGIIDMEYDGADSLVAYGSMDEYGSALMLILRKGDVIAEALEMSNYVNERIAQQIRLTGFVLVGVIIVVVAGALVLSRSIVRNIHKLVEAARRIAAGDFNIRVDIDSRDEMGELGRSFNHMIPELEERVKLKHTLDLAMQVQQSLLPEKPPQVAGLEIAAESRYCDETGGDFYDFLDYCCWGQNAVGIAVGDVSGHGIPAALLMASVRGFLRSRAMQARNVSEMIKDVNQLIARDTEVTHQFVTLFYMECDAAGKRLQWIRAGHEPALFFDPQTDRFEELHGEGLALGVDPAYQYQENARTDLQTGQIILIGTDGIWETTNESGEMFGKTRLKDLLRMHRESTSAEISTAVIHAIDDFRGQAKQDDDVTLVVVKVVDRKPA